MQSCKTITAHIVHTCSRGTFWQATKDVHAILFGIQKPAFATCKVHVILDGAFMGKW